MIFTWEAAVVGRYMSVTGGGMGVEDPAAWLDMVTTTTFFERTVRKPVLQEGTNFR